jgi:Cu-Zn family superoxide dismutase
MAATAARKAEADFTAAPGMKLDGEAVLEEVSNGVRVRVSLEGAPNGMKAIHVHEKGDCSGIRNDDMGQHFNPGATAHGLPTSREHHAGDLGNILVANDGTGKLEIVATNVNLRDEDPTSILNRALVIREGEDVGAQPSGGAGRPIACAVIRKK